MTPACQQALDGVGNGVAASLRAVDCAASSTAQAAFGRLFGSDGALLPALTILLTIYVALFAFALITGRSRVGVSALTPRMVTLGMVLTFATSWMAYSQVVWNLAVGAPDQLAAVLTGVPGRATQVFADKIDVVLMALVEASGNTASEGANSTFSPQGLLWLGGTLLLLGTVGVLATSKIALAILLALGPVFVVLALFPATRGLFTGWLKSAVLLAVVPLFAVLGGSMMLELSVPVLRSITQTPGQIDARAAMAFFMIGAVHVALMAMALKVSGTMVAGWSVFGLARSERPAREGLAAGTGPANSRPSVVSAGPVQEPMKTASAREIRFARATPAAANDSGPGARVDRDRTAIARTIGTGASGTAILPSSSRARGIGSRFRAPPPPVSTRSMERFK